MKKFLTCLLILVILALVGIFITKYDYIINEITSISSNVIKPTENEAENNSANTLEVELTPKEVQIFNGNSRPIAVMIDNVGNARPQAGLNDAYIVYEIIVEGNESRLMAVFKGAEADSVGPIRSSRHYFLDYAMENDAIYVHYGWSPKAKSDISSLKVENINGINESAKSFWRVSDKSAPHNVVTSTEKILNIAQRKGYSTTSEQESVLNYVTEEVELTEGIPATEITLPYSSSYKVTYKYDEETKRYTRGYNKTTQKDWKTGELVTTKNIIVTFAQNSRLNDGSGKDRQDLTNVGTLDGYYITNGKAIEIKCYKSSRTAQTVYKDLQGNEIEVNDGNTFVQIVPIDAKVKIEPGYTTETNIENEIIKNENAIN